MRAEAGVTLSVQSVSLKPASQSSLLLGIQKAAVV